MGQRANSDSAATFDTIVGAARKLLKEEGADRLTLRKVAAAAKLSLGTVQYYFSSRDRLVETCLEEQSVMLEQHIELARAALEAGMPAEGGFAMGVRQVYVAGLENRQTHRLRMLSALSTGLTERSPGPYLLSELSRFSELVVQHTNLSHREARLMSTSVSILVARFASYEEAELRVLLGLGEGDDQADIVGAHLEEVTRALFRMHTSKRG